MLWQYLKVKVSDLFGVQVENSIQDLLEELSGLLFAQRLLFCQKVEELTACNTVRKKKKKEQEEKRDEGKRTSREISQIRSGYKSLNNIAEMSRSNQPDSSEPE